jgi:quinol monooxygenase YgiN
MYSRSDLLSEQELLDFAKRYTAAWCSQDAASVAACYSPGASLTINDRVPAVGRTAIRETAQGFMTAFPDMQVVMDEIAQNKDQDGRAVYRWTLTGTNTGPGGTGRRVRISGYEEWKTSDGLIAESHGYFDGVDYQRQLVQIRTLPNHKEQTLDKHRVSFTVSLAINADKFNEFESTAQEMVAGSRKEPGTLGYDFYLSADRTKCRLLEHYADADAVLAHMTGPVVRELVPKMLEFSMVTGFEVYGDPGVKASEVLAGFGAEIFHMWQALGR